MLKNKHHGFTLIELSIALVIIGLIVGGIVAGKDIIRAAELRSLLSQKDKFTAAVNIFKIKYNEIPGDMKATDTAKFGLFTLTGSAVGRYYNTGDGRGTIYGTGFFGALIEGFCAFECGVFWRHLSDAGLVGSSYGATLESSTDTPGIIPGVPAGSGTNRNVNQDIYMPKAKAVNGYWGAYSIGMAYNFFNWETPKINGIDVTKNVFFIGKQSSAANGYMYEPNMSAADAYSLDLKIDDGKPYRGKFLVSTYDDSFGYYWEAAVNTNSEACTYGGANEFDTANQYNANKGTGGDKLTCKPIFVW